MTFQSTWDATEPVWFVCHGPNAVFYNELQAGQSLASGQPNIEKFTDEAAAKARAIELGYVFEEDDEE